MSKLKKASTAFLCLLAIFFANTAVYAHAPLSEFYPNPAVNEGVVRFFFDDDEWMSDTAVVVYDVHGAQIGTGMTDFRGHFDFSGFANAGLLVATYDVDHVQRHVVGEAEAEVEAPEPVVEEIPPPPVEEEEIPPPVEEEEAPVEEETPIEADPEPTPTPTPTPTPDPTPTPAPTPDSTPTPPTPPPTQESEPPPNNIASIAIAGVVTAIAAVVVVVMLKKRKG